CCFFVAWPGRIRTWIRGLETYLGRVLVARLFFSRKAPTTPSQRRATARMRRMGTADTLSTTQGAHEPAKPPGRGALVAAELARAQYRNIPTAVGVNAVTSALLVVALRETVPPQRLWIWLAAVYAVAAVRYLLWARFNAAVLDEPNTERWRLRAFLGSGANGLVWGLGGIFLYAHGSPSSQFLLLITQFGMGAGAAYASAPSFRSVMAYILPSVL